MDKADTRLQVDGFEKKWEFDVSYREKGDDQIDQNGYVAAQMYMDAKILSHKQENLF